MAKLKSLLKAKKNHVWKLSALTVPDVHEVPKAGKKLALTGANALKSDGTADPKLNQKRYLALLLCPDRFKRKDGSIDTSISIKNEVADDDLARSIVLETNADAPVLCKKLGDFKWDGISLTEVQSKATLLALLNLFVENIV